MIKVPICIFEDAAIPSGDRINQLLDFPRIEKARGQTYEFILGDYNPFSQLGVYEPEVLLNERKTWLSAAQYLSTLSGPAILFFDIHHAAEQDNIPLEAGDFSESFVSSVAPLSGAPITDAPAMLAWANPYRLGFLLSVCAATNANFSGVATFASMRTNVEVEIEYLRSISSKRIFWKDLGYSLTTITPEKVVAAINQAIKEFLARNSRPPIWT